MSIAPRNSSQFRNDSGELVVFEAARYFSGGDESSCNRNSSSVFPHHDGGGAATASRMSLDMPAINTGNISAIPKQYLTREKKKYKQPSSPGGRLASFLNSLFNQTNSKKKKKSKKSGGGGGGGAAARDEEDCYPHDRRRSSISHIRITASSASNNQDPNSPYSAAATPPSYAKTPTKSSYGDLKIFSDLQKKLPPRKDGDNVAAIEQFRFNDESFRNPRTKCTAYDEDKRKFEKFSDGDDGDSDSSSDLFDLPSLDFYSRDLPVYATTDMGRIRIGAPTRQRNLR